ncbi:MAG: pyridoxal phosphate-dependent aminotransferase [Acutalibacteraceae bacterium]|nr:pyridoxal phosphate-dependent aminotransferase [Acutalibacteraceae bacterium]
MISEKMMGLGKKRSVIREIFEYGNKRRQEIGAENVFDFSLGNPSIPAPEFVNDTMKRLITEKDSVALHGYTSAQGALPVRQAISDHINKRFSIGATPDLLYMTCGAAASLTITLNALINSGDEVIVLAPFFPEYRVFAEKAGAEIKIVKCRESDFQIDFEALEKALNKNTKAIIVNSPNNPSGVVLNEDTIGALAELLDKKSKEYGTDIYIIADEPYRELVYGGVEVPYIPNYYNNTIVCYSYSKSLSLPGERIGYIFVSPRITNCSDVYAAVCGAGRALGFVCAPSLLQYTVAECFGLTGDISAYEKNRNILYNALTEYGYTAAKPDGAFYLFVKSPEKDANAFCERAKKYELLLVPGDDFGFEGYIRISYCVSTEMIEKSLPSFKKLIEEYR